MSYQRLLGTVVTSMVLFLVGIPTSLALNPNPQSVLEGLDRARTIATQGALRTDSDVVTPLTSIINWLLSIVAVLALLAIVVGGILYIISFGDEKRADKAKKIILYAVIGLLVVGLSFTILAAVRQFILE
jgi:hypothetical protein